MPNKTEFYFFKGKASWAKIKYPDFEYKNWQITVHLDGPSYDQFIKLKEGDDTANGILNDVKQNDDGYYVIFRRPMTKTWNGKETQLTPPMVFDKEGNPFDGEIGNGSDVTVKVELYYYNKPMKKGKGRAIRFNSVRVDNLVPYTREDYTEDQKKKAEGFNEQPVQYF